MTKKSIITLSILSFLIALIGVLFGAVFRLRSQVVSVPEHNVVEVSKNEIISAAGLKNGQSIFMIDKQEAINNIEAKFPYIKVIQIKTTSVIKIDIKIRTRHEMLYTEFDNKFYVMDEDLKVLDIIEKSASDEPSNEPTNLTQIETDSLNIDEKVKICDFVGNKHERQVVAKLYHAIINNVKEKTDDKIEYYTREDVCALIKNIKFEKYDSFDKIVLTTKYGVKLDIENSRKDLTNKINICLTTMNKFIEDGKDKEKSGTIKIYYDLNNIQKCVYIPQE